MAKKNKYSPDQLYESLMSSIDIQCTKCKYHATQHGIDEWEACDAFFNMGWRATANNVYCTECAHKYLKK